MSWIYLFKLIFKESYEKVNDEDENNYEQKKAVKIPIEKNTMIIAAAGPFTNKDSLSFAPLCTFFF